MVVARNCGSTSVATIMAALLGWQVNTVPQQRITVNVLDGVVAGTVTWQVNTVRQQRITCFSTPEARLQCTLLAVWEHRPPCPLCAR
ncbi:MAG TPA: hypothetical protein DEP84_12820 [Chloroflexi bacterium]|nr:hypothetical protein [Chloroflexota bacterium]